MLPTFSKFGLRTSCWISIIGVLAILQGCGTKPTVVESESTSELSVIQKSISGDQASMSEVTGVFDTEAAIKFEKIVGALLRSDYVYAEAQLLELIEKNPSYASPYINLGIVYRKTGRANEARGIFEKAIVVMPKHCAPRIQLALLERELLNLDAAVQAYFGCLEVEPNNLEAHFNLGILYELYLGDWHRAIDAYGQYQSLSGSAITARWITDLQRRIERSAQLAAGGRSE